MKFLFLINHYILKSCWDNVLLCKSIHNIHKFWACGWCHKRKAAQNGKDGWKAKGKKRQRKKFFWVTDCLVLKESLVMSKSCTYPLTTQNIWGFNFLFLMLYPNLMCLCFSKHKWMFFFALLLRLLVSWRHDVKEMNQFEKEHSPLKEDRI